MKSKIIVHNESDINDGLALILASKIIRDIPEYEYFEFNDGHKAQGIKRKTCKTICIYGGKNAE